MAWYTPKYWTGKAQALYYRRKLQTQAIYRKTKSSAALFFGVSAKQQQQTLQAAAAEVKRIEKEYGTKGWIGQAPALKPGDIGKIAGVAPVSVAPTPRVERVFLGSPEFRAQQRIVEAMSKEYAKYTKEGVYTSPSVTAFEKKWASYTIMGHFIGSEAEYGRYTAAHGKAYAKQTAEIGLYGAQTTKLQQMETVRQARYQTLQDVYTQYGKVETKYGALRAASIIGKYERFEEKTGKFIAARTPTWQQVQKGGIVTRAMAKERAWEAEHIPGAKRFDTAMEQYKKGVYEGMREQPLKTAVTTAAFFAMPAALKGVGMGLKAARITPTIAKIPKVGTGIIKYAPKAIGTGIGAAYGASVGYRVYKTPPGQRAYELGKISGTELLPMGVGAYAGMRAMPWAARKLPSMSEARREFFGVIRSKRGAVTLSPSRIKKPLTIEELYARETVEDTLRAAGAYKPRRVAPEIYKPRRVAPEMKPRDFVYERQVRYDQPEIPKMREFLPEKAVVEPGYKRPVITKVREPLPEIVVGLPRIVKTVPKPKVVKPEGYTTYKQQVKQSFASERARLKSIEIDAQRQYSAQMQAQKAAQKAAQKVMQVQPQKQGIFLVPLFRQKQAQALGLSLRQKQAQAQIQKEIAKHEQRAKQQFKPPAVPAAFRKPKDEERRGIRYIAGPEYTLPIIPPPRIVTTKITPPIREYRIRPPPPITKAQLPPPLIPIFIYKPPKEKKVKKQKYKREPYAWIVENPIPTMRQMMTTDINKITADMKKAQTGSKPKKTKTGSKPKKTKTKRGKKK